MSLVSLARVNAMVIKPLLYEAETSSRLLVVSMTTAPTLLPPRKRSSTATSPFALTYAITASDPICIDKKE